MSDWSSRFTERFNKVSARLNEVQEEVASHHSNMQWAITSVATSFPTFLYLYAFANCPTQSSFVESLQQSKTRKLLEADRSSSGQDKSFLEQTAEPCCSSVVIPQGENQKVTFVNVLLGVGRLVIVRSDSELYFYVGILQRWILLFQRTRSQGTSFPAFYLSKTIHI